MAYTLDSAEYNGIRLGQPGLYRHDQSVSYADAFAPAGNLQIMKQSAHITPYANDNIDIRAPGIRDQVQNPSFPYVGPYRSSLYDTNSVQNNAPIPGWDSNVPSYMQTRQNARFGAEMWTTLYETPVKEHWSFREFGQFNVPYTGFTAFANLKPASTMAWI